MFTYIYYIYIYIYVHIYICEMLVQLISTLKTIPFRIIATSSQLYLAKHIQPPPQRPKASTQMRMIRITIRGEPPASAAWRRCDAMFGTSTYGLRTSISPIP